MYSSVWTKYRKIFCTSTTLSTHRVINHIGRYSYFNNFNLRCFLFRKSHFPPEIVRRVQKSNENIMVVGHCSRSSHFKLLGGALKVIIYYRDQSPTSGTIYTIYYVIKEITLRSVIWRMTCSGGEFHQSTQYNITACNYAAYVWILKVPTYIISFSYIYIAI